MGLPAKAVDWSCIPVVVAGRVLGKKAGLVLGMEEIERASEVTVTTCHFVGGELKEPASSGRIERQQLVRSGRIRSRTTGSNWQSPPHPVEVNSKPAVLRPRLFDQLFGHPVDEGHMFLEGSLGGGG